MNKVDFFVSQTINSLKPKIHIKIEFYYYFKRKKLRYFTKILLVLKIKYYTI